MRVVEDFEVGRVALLVNKTVDNDIDSFVGVLLGGRLNGVVGVSRSECIAGVGDGSADGIFKIVHGKARGTDFDLAVDLNELSSVGPALDVTGKKAIVEAVKLRPVWLRRRQFSRR